MSEMTKAEKILVDFCEAVKMADDLEYATIFGVGFMCGLAAADPELEKEVEALMQADNDFDEGFEII